MPIIVGEIITESISSTGALSITSDTGDIQIGSFSWPATASISSSVLKTDGVGGLTFEPAIVRSVVTTSTYTITTSDDIVALSVAQATTLTLPDPTLKNEGDLIYVVKEISGTDVITILPFGTELISGASSATLSFSYGTVKLYTNNVNWFALF